MVESIDYSHNNSSTLDSTSAVVNTGDIYHIAVNQTNELFATATNEGFEIFSIQPFNRKLKRRIEGGLKIVEMLDKTNFLAFVGSGKCSKYPTNKVVIWNDKDLTHMGEINFKTEVQAIRIRQDKIIIVLTHKVLGYDLKNFGNFTEISTYANPCGIMALTIPIGAFQIAVPHTIGGKVMLTSYTADLNQHSQNIIDAHKSNISQMALNYQGNMLATASIIGTVIRIFNTESGQRIQELRRGLEPANILDLVFDLQSQYLVASSEKKTIHVFRVAQENTTSYFRMVAPVIPYCGSEWSFANFSIESESYPVVSVVDNNLYVMTRCGRYYKAVIKPEGGVCMAEDTQSLLEDIESITDNMQIS